MLIQSLFSCAGFGWLSVTLCAISLLLPFSVLNVTGQAVDLSSSTFDLIAEDGLSPMISLVPLAIDPNDAMPSLKSSSSDQNCDTAEENKVKGLYASLPPSHQTIGRGGYNGPIHEGESITFGIRTSSKLSANAVVNITDQPSLAIPVVSDVSSLTFTPSNWCILQFFTITATDNSKLDATLQGVKINVSLADTAYPEAKAHREFDLTFRHVYDNDTGQGIDLSNADLEVDEGESKTFTVKISSEPETPGASVSVQGPVGKVTIPDSHISSNGDEFFKSFFFTPENDNWNQPQTVTIEGLEDDNGVDEMIDLTIRASGGGYGFLDPITFKVKVIDDDEQELIVSPSSLKMNEGSSKEYTVKLSTKPTDDVTISIRSDNSDVTVDTDPNTPGNQTSLDFTSSSWNTEQTVTVRARQDNDGVNDTATLTNTASGGDYADISKNIEVTVTDDDDIELVVSKDAMDVPEGGNDSYTVKLATEPTATVTVEVTGTTGEITVDTDSNTSGDQNTLTFTTSNWNTEQTVTVSAGEDDDGVNDTAMLTNTASGGDYADISKDVDITVIDNDDIELVVSTDELEVPEGGNNTYTIELSTQPTETVTVEVTGATGDITVDTDSNTQGDQNTLTFTTSTWNTPQTITVTAAEDDDGEDDTATLINLASGADEYVSTRKEVAVTVIDDDDQAIIVDPLTLNVNEGSSGTYTVKLATQPTAQVTVQITSSSTDVISNPTPLTFTDANWKDGKTVTVNALDDNDAVDNEVTLTHQASGGDYGSVDEEEVTVNVTDDDEATLTIDPTELSIDEGGSKTYTIALSSQPSGNVTVTIAGESGEITVNQTSWTFTPTNWSPKTVTVSAGEDGDVADDSATLVNTASGADEYSGTEANVEVTVTDNDEIGLDVAPQSINVSEGGNNSYTVKLATQPTASVTVNIEGATSDVTTSSSSLTFTTTNWSDVQTVTVSAAQDDNGANEEVTLTNRPSGGGYGSATAVEVTVNVTDNDTPELTVVPTSLTLNEGGASGSYTVKLSTQPTSDVTVTVNSPPTKVSVDTDLNMPNVQSTLLFTSLDWGEKIVTVFAKQDDDGQNDTVILRNTASGTEEYADAPSVPVTINITDDDVPALVVKPSSLTIQEGQSDSYTVELETQPTTNVTVRVTGATGEVSANPSTLSFNSSNWNEPTRVTVSAGTDNDGNNDSAVLVNRASGGEYSSADTKNVGITVIDDGPRASLSISSKSVEEGEPITVTIELASAVTTESVITLDYTDHETELTDFEARPTEVTIPSGQPRGSINIVTDDDDTVEPIESFTVAIDPNRLPPRIKLGAPSSERITITDNDVDPPVEITMELNPSSVVEGDPVKITVNLQKALSKSVTIPFAYSTGPGVAAQSDVDYIQLKRLVIPAGRTSMSGDIQTKIDNNVEGPETFSVSFGTLPIEVDGGRPISLVVTILDNLPTITLSVDLETIEEGEEASVTATMSRALESNVTIPLNLIADTATPDDYEIQSTEPQVIINRGQTRGNIRILAENDHLIEGDERFTVELGPLPPSVNEGVPSSVQITIRSDDVAGIDAETSVVISEGESRNVRVSLTAQPDGPVSVRVSKTGDDDNDLSFTPAVLPFTSQNWNQTQDILLTASQDEDSENDDDILLTLNASGDDFDDVEHEIRVEIIDDDQPGLFVQRTLTINEGGDEILYVHLTQMPTNDVTVTLSDYSGTDLTLQSLPTLTFTTANYQNNQSFSLMAQQDDDSIDDPVQLTLQASGGGYNLTEMVDVTIRDDEVAEIVVTPLSLEIQEGESGEFSVNLTAQPTSLITVAITGYNGTDLTPLTTELSFSSSDWSTPHPVNLQSVVDLDLVNDPVTLTLSASGGEFDGKQEQLRVTILDAGAVSITIFPNDALENEGTIRLPLELNRPLLNEVITVQYATSPGTALSGDDYIPSQGIVIFDPGGTRGVIQIEIRDDEVVEDPETFTIELRSPRNAVIGNPSATATIKDDDGISTLAIEDAIAVEDDGRISFPVHLSHPSPHPITVQYYTVDGTASAGKDYVETTGMLTFAPGAMLESIVVPLLHNDFNWHEETFYVHIESSEPARISKSSAIAVIQDETNIDQDALIAYATRFVRTTSELVIDALHQRFQPAGSTCSVAERSDMARLWHTTSSWTPSLGELLSGCQISKTSSTSVGEFGYWARGSFQRFHGRSEDAFSLRGNVASALVGVDYRLNSQWLIGIMSSINLGDGSYQIISVREDIESRLNGYYPYLLYESAGWEMWLSGGYGSGHIKVDDLRVDLTSWLGAVGLRGNIAVLNSTHMSYFGDVLYTDANLDIGGLHGEVIRVRLGVESAFQLFKGIHPYLEANVRQDGGDAETGIGLELGGGVRMSYLEGNVTGDIRSQGLVLHSADGFSEWGVSVSIQMGDPTLGFSMRIRPSWGANQVQSLQRQQTILDYNPLQSHQHRTEVELGYGMPMHDGTARSIVGVTQLPGGQLLRLGGELRPWSHVSFSISGLAHHRQAFWGDLGLNMHGSVRF